MDKSMAAEKEEKSEIDLRARFDTKDPEEHRELIEDLAIADQALAEYDARGIEGTTSYNEYRVRRLEITD